ncbi:Kinetochore-associated protein Dsn1/Mis13 [Phaffia rhodozyma]|uniref:Kinetochore-associated protein Dsn1/Mis13 n=1 Tax=Phaffia rhodozyma TaxID=264483 RepID=A0A0F7SHW1_PHARH|nr:Kinetochore-associated protein Dsn1/Mis13 [Phaffia rhodozyma]
MMAARRPTSYRPSNGSDSSVENSPGSHPLPSLAPPIASSSSASSRPIAGASQASASSVGLGLPGLDATEEEVFGIAARNKRRIASQELPIEALHSQSHDISFMNHVESIPPILKPKKASKLNPIPIAQDPMPPPVSSSSNAFPPPLSPRQFSRTMASPPRFDRLDIKRRRVVSDDSSINPGSRQGTGDEIASNTSDVLVDQVADERTKRSKVVGKAKLPKGLSFLNIKPPPVPSSSKPKPSTSTNTSSASKSTRQNLHATNSSKSANYSLPSLPPQRSNSNETYEDVTGDTTVPLQISDTPMIKRNQEMRRNVSRKSSFGKRGQRASASFGKGEPTAPHHSIPTSAFHKHIDGEFPEAIRMRHLLVFLGHRESAAMGLTADSLTTASALGTTLKGKGKGKGKEDGRNPQGDEIAGQVVDALLKALMGAKLDTNPQGSSSQPMNLLSKPTRPHPGNVLNRKAEQEGEAFIKKGKTEEALWSAAVKLANALQTKTCEALATKSTSSAVDLSSLDTSNAEIAEYVREVLEREVEIDGPEDLEYQVDFMNQITQTAAHLSTETTRLTDQIFTSLTQTLRSRTTPAIPPSLSLPQTVLPGPSTTVTSTSLSSSLTNQPLTSTSISPVASTSPRSFLRVLASKDKPSITEETARLVDTLNKLPPPPTTGPVSLNPALSLATSSTVSNATSGPNLGLTSAVGAGVGASIEGLSEAIVQESVQGKGRKSGVPPPPTPRRGTGTATTPFKSGRTPGR